MIPDLIRTKISKIVPPSKKMLLFNIEEGAGEQKSKLRFPPIRPSATFSLREKG
jgi:hypothetical protein